MEKYSIALFLKFRSENICQCVINMVLVEDPVDVVNVVRADIH